MITIYSVGSRREFKYNKKATREEKNEEENGSTQRTGKRNINYSYSYYPRERERERETKSLARMAVLQSAWDHMEKKTKTLGFHMLKKKKKK